MESKKIKGHCKLIIFLSSLMLFNISINLLNRFILKFEFEFDSIGKIKDPFKYIYIEYVKTIYDINYSLNFLLFFSKKFKSDRRIRQKRNM